MKKILITGINGFIGSYCRDYFTKSGYCIYGIDLAGSEAKNIIIGEVDKHNLCLFDEKFDIIIHLAGSGTVSMAQNSPEVERVKSVGSCEQILQYINNYNKNARLIYASSAAVYGDNFNCPIKEDAVLNPISVYGLHKLESENLCAFYAKTHNLDIKIVRFFSLYGNGLKKQLLWDFMKRVKNADGNNIECFGSGLETRDFIHIEDAVRFFELLFELKKSFDIYNCASGISVTVKEIMQLLLKEYGKNYNLIFDNIKREGNPNILIADINKAKSINFSPQITPEKGIKKYVEWFKKVIV